MLCDVCVCCVACAVWRLCVCCVAYQILDFLGYGKPSDSTTAASREIFLAAAHLAKSTPSLNMNMNMNLQRLHESPPLPTALQMLEALGGAAALYDKDAYAALVRDTVDAASFQTVHSVEMALVPAGKRRGLGSAPGVAVSGAGAGADAPQNKLPSGALLERYKSTKCVLVLVAPCVRVWGETTAGKEGAGEDLLGMGFQISQVMPPTQRATMIMWMKI